MPPPDPTPRAGAETGPVPLIESRSSADVVQASAELLHSQNRVLELVAKGAPLTEIFDLYLRSIESHSPGMLSSILLLDDDGVHVRHAAAPSLPEAYTRAIDGLPIGPSAGSCGTAAHRRTPVIVEDIASDPLWAEYKDAALPHGLRACWSTPILDPNGRVLGTFALYFRMPGRPSPRHRHLIGVTTHTAAVAIMADRERKRTASRIQQLETAQRLVGAGSFEWNVRLNTVVCSNELCRMFGMMPDAGPTTLDGYLEQAHPDDRARARKAFEDSARDKSSVELEMRIVRPGGEVRRLRTRGEWIVPEGGDSARLVGAVQDLG